MQENETVKTEIIKQRSFVRFPSFQQHAHKLDHEDEDEEETSNNLTEK